ncbi:hypothetical protein KTT_38860 [Tengunoibacter tsumagoiensis]|uniref:Rhamnogalacturonase A/B/Epimerase-like pectate lyase domain-containing protein n=1 Tax=Tengunoibacter tsumagoiensis TaxID=2014871 RepID=A0A402A4F2_9CHLR|nr:hypothetical protein KTT_38860 [Tengunoibacter tsumagoiensis]
MPGFVALMLATTSLLFIIPFILLSHVQAHSNRLAIPHFGGGNAHIVRPLYSTGDIVVADYDATSAPYFADPGGSADATAAIQTALNDCSDGGGGTVWLAAGQYKVTGSIIIPPHCTLRGDWRNPDAGSGSYGTVILANVASGSETDPGLFRISGSAGVNGLTIYYPNQSIANPTPYPYTIEILGRLLNEDGYMLGSVKHITLLNSYRGISAGARATHEMHTIDTVKGTVLVVGMYLQDSADVDETENVTLNNNYWASIDASVSNQRPARSDLDAWTRANGTGLKMGGLEWDRFANLSFSDYQIGIDIVQQSRMTLSVSMFGISVFNSNIALRIDGNYLNPNQGIQIANSTLQANQGTHPIAVQVGDTSNSSILFNGVTIGGGAETAVQLTGQDLLEFQNCTFDNWSGPYAITASRGSVVVQGSSFSPTLSGGKKGLNLQSGLSSASLLGNSYTGGSLYDNSSSATVAVQDSGFSFVNSGISSYTFALQPHPDSNNFYDVESSPYNAHGDGSTDDTGSIQNALNDAGNAGGGTVYLPAAIYAIRGHLSVPGNVELRGADSMPHRTTLLNGGRATGTILFAYEGRSSSTADTDPALITLNGTNAGVRGIGIHYPEQANDSASNIVAYPWSIRGNGTGVYVYDVSLSNAYEAVDFARYPTNGHIIHDVNGFALEEGVRVGQSNEGWVENSVFNLNAWARTGGLPNSLDENTTMFPVAGTYSRAHETAYEATSGAQNEHWMGAFSYGSQTGFVVDSDANVTAINSGSDGSPNTVYISNTGGNGASFLNLLGCGCGLNGVGVHLSGGTTHMFNVSTEVSYNLALLIEGGSYTVQGGMFSNSLAMVTGGNGILAGNWFKDGGTQVTVSNSGTYANLWGNIGNGGFTYTFTNGAPILITGNIPR